VADYNYACDGHIGDAVFTLHPIHHRSLSGDKANYYLQHDNRDRFDRSVCLSLSPLIEYQDYISDVVVTDVVPEDCLPHEKDIRFKDYYEVTGNHNMAYVNLKKRHFRAMNADRSMRWCLENFKSSGPWLKAPAVQAADVVAHLPTGRLTRSIDSWVKVLDSVREHSSVLVIGGDDVSEWEGHAECHKPDSMLEAASLINGCKLFIGASSCNYVIAEGLGKLRFVDIHPNSSGTRPRDETGWDTSKWDDDTLCRRIRDCIR